VALASRLFSIQQIVCVAPNLDSGTRDSRHVLEHLRVNQSVSLCSAALC
jgi:hypothetical protein